VPSSGRRRKPASRKPRGRPPTKLTDVLAARLIGYLEAGAYLSHAAPACGIDRRTVYGWLEVGRMDAAAGKADTIHAVFVRAIEKARGKAMVQATKEVRLAGRKDWRASAWYLSRVAPDLFGERIEVDARAEAHLERLGDPADDEAGAMLDDLDDGELDYLDKLATREAQVLARALARRRKKPPESDDADA
jgi:hypothetical protein